MKLLNNLMSFPAHVIFMGLLLLLGAFNFIAFSGNYGGDPQIHLIFAENLLDGHLLEFNKGFRTSGETSPIYMLIVALFLLIGGPIFATVAMKFMAMIALITCCCVCTTNYKNGVERMLVMAGIIAVPSLLFQAFLGMENLIFTLCFILLISSMLETEEKAGHDLKSSLWYCLGIFCLFFLRPEAIFLTLVGCFQCLIGRKNRLAVVYGLTAIVIVGSLEVFQTLWGGPLHGAGEIRAITGRSQSATVSILGHITYVSFKPIYFFGSVIPFLALLPTHSDRQPISKMTRTLVAHSLIIAFILSAHFFLLLPNTHFTRYQIYLFFWSLVLINFAQRNCKLGIRPQAIAVCSLLLLTLWTIEHISRDLWFKRSIFAPNAIEKVINHGSPPTYDVRQIICTAIECTAQSNITIATIEVQSAAKLGEGFFIASLDGVTDHALANFIDDKGCIDHLGYLSFRSVDVIMDFPDYSPPNHQCASSLKEVEAKLAEGQAFDTEAISIKPFNFRITGRSPTMWGLVSHNH